MNPTIEEWLALPADEIAATVQSRELGVMLSIDGTRRHYLLAQPELNGQITSFEDYSKFTTAAYAHVYDILFRLGVQTIMTSLLYPPNFLRGGRYLQQSLGMTKLLLLTGAIPEVCQKWQARMRLYGDFDFAPNAEPIRAGLQEVAQNLRNATPHGQKLVLFGYSAGSFPQEMIDRTLMLEKKLGRAPSEEQLNEACFPDGPKQLNMVICAGSIRVGTIVPTTLDKGGVDIYNLPYLALDLQESAMRRMLYDHLFLRSALSDDFMEYTPDTLKTLGDYYQQHAECVIGLGHIVGPGMWYADHEHNR